MAQSGARDAPVSLPMAGCVLDSSALEEQLGRYRELRHYVRRLRRTAGELVVEFGDDVPAGLLRSTLEIERDCCSFLEITYDADGRQLTIAAEGQDAVLAALESSLE
jgi:hypothetical protein